MKAAESMPRSIDLRGIGRKSYVVKRMKKD